MNPYDITAFVSTMRITERENQMEPIIEIKNITKEFKVLNRREGLKGSIRDLFSRDYKIVRAVDNISMSIEQGEIVGYLGPNGAGKSTTIKMMTGVLEPTSGEILVGGNVPYQNRTKNAQEIGVVFGQRSQLWWDVPVTDSFELLKDIYSIPSEVYRKNRDELSELLDLGDIIRTPARQLSLGQRMRCELAASLLHSPDILFLDEPTIGLDSVSKIAVREFIVRLNSERKTTVILTTHDMQDIEAITKRIILIGKGKILLDGDINDISGSGDIDRAVADLYRSYEI